MALKNHDPNALILPDILGSDMRVLFVGFNPSVRAAQLGHHYAGRGNQFWRLLAASGMTPRLLAPAEDRFLATWGYGLTNLVSRPTVSAAELSRSELRSGVPHLQQLVLEYRPSVLAYTGKGVYLAATGAARAPWGLQERSLFQDVLDVVLSSPSGLARLPFSEKLSHYQALRMLLEEKAADAVR